MLSSVLNAILWTLAVSLAYGALWMFLGIENHPWMFVMSWLFYSFVIIALVHSFEPREGSQSFRSFFRFILSLGFGVVSLYPLLIALVQLQWPTEDGWALIHSSFLLYALPLSIGATYTMLRLSPWFSNNSVLTRRLTGRGKPRRAG